MASSIISIKRMSNRFDLDVSTIVNKVLTGEIKHPGEKPVRILSRGDRDQLRAQLRLVRIHAEMEIEAYDRLLIPLLKHD